MKPLTLAQICYEENPACLRKENRLPWSQVWVLFWPLMEEKGSGSTKTEMRP